MVEFLLPPPGPRNSLRGARHCRMTDAGKCLSRRPREASIPPIGRFSFVPPPLIRSNVSWRGRDLRAEERDDAYPVSAAGDPNGEGLADLIVGALGALAMTGAPFVTARLRMWRSVILEQAVARQKAAMAVEGCIWPTVPCNRLSPAHPFRFH